MATIRDHVRHLAQNNPEQFAEFEARLGRDLLHRYFYRSVEPHANYNLRKINGPLMLILMEFLPFENWHFTSNTLPELQDYSTVKSLQS